MFSKKALMEFVKGAAIGAALGGLIIFVVTSTAAFAAEPVDRVFTYPTGENVLLTTPCVDPATKAALELRNPELLPEAKAARILWSDGKTYAGCYIERDGFIFLVEGDNAILPLIPSDLYRPVADVRI